MNKSSNTATLKIPVCICQECNLEKQAYGFTSLVMGEGLPTKDLCATCFNSFAAKRMGVAPPRPSEFEPILLFDSVGKEHRFYFQVHLSTGLGITAHEINERGQPCGYSFSVMQHPATPSTDAYTKLVEKMKIGLSVRYLQSSDFGSFSSQNRLYIKNNSIVGRIEENETGPTAVIDGIEYSWEELGQFVSSQMGFNFRLECFDPYDEIDFSSKVERADSLLWLERPHFEETEKKFR